MTLLALDYFAPGSPMHEAYRESEPLFYIYYCSRSVVPQAIAFYTSPTEVADSHKESVSMETPVRVFNTPDTPVPEVQLLSNGRYSPNGDKCRRRLQPLERHGITRFPGRQYLRQLWHFLLSPRCNQRGCLGHGLSAYARNNLCITRPFFGWPCGIFAVMTMIFMSIQNRCFTGR